MGIMIFWIVVFVVAVAALVKGSHWFLHGAERIGLSFGMSPFLIGVLIVGVGTSFPELVSSVAGVIKGIPEIVVANAVGSNIANILLVLGVIAVMGRKLEVSKNLIDLELPLLAISTVLFVGIVYDGQVHFLEAVMLFASYLIYLLYSIFSQGGETVGAVMEHQTAKIQRMAREEWSGMSQFVYQLKARKDYVFFVVGIALVLGGAKYLIDAVIALSEIWNIAPGVISVTAIAIGTSLPELFVSGRAVLDGKSEVAIGNILGSNAFNALMVVGLPGLFSTLPVDPATLAVGVPMMAAATLLFVLSGISKKLYHWEGMMFLMLYVFFILKLFNIV